MFLHNKKDYDPIRLLVLTSFHSPQPLNRPEPNFEERLPITWILLIVSVIPPSPPSYKYHWFIAPCSWIQFLPLPSYFCLLT